MKQETGVCKENVFGISLFVFKKYLEQDIVCCNILIWIYWCFYFLTKKKTQLYEKKLS